MVKVAKRLKKVAEICDAEKLYSLDKALSVLKEYQSKCAVKFDESVEFTMKLGIDPRQTDQMVRGVVPMPNGLGKKVRVAVICKPEKIQEAQASGADVFGSDEFVDEIKAGRLDFDVCISTPDMMVKVGALGKVLGPKGLMPNPKLGTVTTDIKAAVAQVKAGQVEYKVEKAGLIHAAVGKLSFDIAALKENILALYEALKGAKPSSSKGVYMQKMFLGTTMGPAIAVDLQKVVS
jgi:large subunit ribosomal protein L1